MRAYTAVLLLAFSLLTIGCSSDSEKTPTEKEKEGLTTKATLSGHMTDIAGRPLADVQVHVGDQSTSTDSDGYYLMELGIEGNVSVTADLQNHAQNARVVTLKDATTTELDMTLVTIDALVSFDASAGETITVKGAQVALPVDGYVNADGTPYSGVVTAKASYNRVTNLPGDQAFPGSFIGLESDGSTTGIRSYGFIDLLLEDADGNPLQLAEGATATLTFPMDPTIEETPATIPFWYYDTQKGIWVEEGFATYDAATDSYSGQVTHFTTWNLDAKFDGARFSGCVEDANGMRLPVADLYITTPGWNKHVTNTDAAGDFTFINVPSALDMTIYASLGTQFSQPYTFSLTPGEEKTLPACLHISLDASALFSTVSGRLQYSDGSPITNRSVNIFNADGQLVNVVTDSDGAFVSTAFVRPETRAFTVSFYAALGNASETVEKHFLLHPTVQNTDIGTIVVAATHVTGCLVQADGNTTFSDTNTDLTVDTPFRGNSRGNNRVYNTDLFDLYLLKDFTAHTLYADFTHYRDIATAPARVSAVGTAVSLYGTTSFTADQDQLDLTSQCIVLSPQSTPPLTVTASTTATDTELALAVIYDQYQNYDNPRIYGENIVGGYQSTPVNSADFEMDKNGIYYIMQTSGGCQQATFDGTIGVSISGQDYNLTITPTTANEAWAGFAIEFYQGSVNVVTLNRAGGAGNCD